ncbi:MAG: sigma-70 family RNA polymerase sigma factor [Tannerella sp.]|jgi:RNA polymerase sigma-70 factor (ECF subfamily)|nr:sigma-70 family RNA polymerase sigma factor [Tannerella sp.]
MEKDIHTKFIEQLRDQGSREAFAKLYMLYSEQVYGFALKLTKSPVEAEDILQETFIRIWDNRTNLSPTSFKSYLFKISYHLVVDHFRRQLDTVDFEGYINSEYYQGTAENETEQQINLDDYRKLIAESVSRLTPRQQEIFRLSRDEELPAKEIAVSLGISEKTVNNQLSIIIGILRADILLFFYLYVL